MDNKRVTIVFGGVVFVRFNYHGHEQYANVEWLEGQGVQELTATDEQIEQACDEFVLMSWPEIPMVNKGTLREKEAEVIVDPYESRPALDPERIAFWLVQGIWRRSQIGGGQHEYVVMQRQPTVYRYFANIITEHGHLEPFFKRKFRYWYHLDYRYWLDGNILNRAQIKNIPEGSGYPGTRPEA